MHISFMGINYTHSKTFSINRPSGSGDFLLLIFRTPAEIKLPDGLFKSDKYAFIFYQPGTIQHYYPTGDSFANDFVHFTCSEADFKFLKSLDIPFDTLIRLPDLKPLSAVFKMLYTEYLSGGQHRKETEEYLFKVLLLKLSELVSSGDNIRFSRYYDDMLKLRAEIYNHPGKKRTLAALAAQMGLSISHFQLLYKRFFHISCIADVIESKMVYAKTLLRSTDETVSEIAERLGYENDVHFMRQFKKLMGVTPSEFRKSLE